MPETAINNSTASLTEPSTEVHENNKKTRCQPSLNSEKTLKPLNPVPRVGYERAKRFLRKHKALHFLLHNIFCRLTLRYSAIPFSEFHSGGR